MTEFSVLERVATDHIAGTVERGEGRGQDLGFPTANLRIDESTERALSSGVYACRVQIGKGMPLEAVANIGVRPTFDESDVRVEVHILDFSSRDLYGETLQVELIEKLRDEERFAGIGQLTEQIERDVEKARSILKADNER
jgi:riboflavin kinase/FMN adenylyltransferase